MTRKLSRSEERQSEHTRRPVASMMNQGLSVLLFVIEWFAVGSYLNLRFLSVGIDLGLVGDELAFFGERLHFEDLSFTGFGLQTGFHVRGKGIENDLLFDFDDRAVSGDENVLAVAVDQHFRFVKSLAFFFFRGKSFDGGSFALGTGWRVVAVV